MKKTTLATLSLAMLGATGAAHAQSSVTLYGIVDTGITFLHNVANSNGVNQGNQVSMSSGNLSGNRFGLKGTDIWVAA
jgi:predicted porin